MLFDTHCHLDASEFESDRDQVVAEAIAAGVGAILVPAVEVANFAAVKALCAPARFSGSAAAAEVALPGNGAPPADSLRSPQRGSLRSQKIAIYAAWGIHPMYTPHAREPDIAILRRWLSEERPVALGEIGLDGFVPGLDMARQEWFLAEQLKLARDFDLPVLLHIRRAQDLVLKHLRRSGVRGGIAHAFNGSRQQAEEFIKLGFKLGFGGAMTFAGSTRIRALAATLPLEHIVLETDAPDIPPAWSTARNTPAAVARYATVLAELRRESRESIVETTTRTACSLLFAAGRG
ncbi:MAG TPA: TatD family hydrolase [Rhodocyclaceae bacterium]|nr:TatD family hydrolase [Rhodocyclaceae bacterium]